MKTLAALVFGALLLLLAFDKVRNEHRMTDMYERQAVALERIANGMRDGLYLDNGGLLRFAVAINERAKGVEAAEKALAIKRGVEESIAHSVEGCGMPSDSCADRLRQVVREMGRHKPRKPDSDAGLTMEQRAEKAARRTDCQLGESHDYCR